VEIEKSGKRPYPTFRVGYAYPKVRSKRGVSLGASPPMREFVGFFYIQENDCKEFVGIFR